MRKHITKTRSYAESPNVGDDIEARVSATLELAYGIGYCYAIEYHHIRNHQE
jgi:hypothetical protein